MVIGDARRADTTQFDMVRAFSALVSTPVLPLGRHLRMDIVDGHFAGAAIAWLHLQLRLAPRIYHVSSGTGSPTAGEIADAVAHSRGRRAPRFAPVLAGPGAALCAGAARLRRPRSLARAAALMDVFWPYIPFDTVFDNRRLVAELGRAPASFLDCRARLYEFAVRNRFRYPYQALVS
jgi:nucleoside-diphosphate-sugar epimerase